MGLQVLMPSKTVFLIIDEDTAEEIHKALLVLFYNKRLGDDKTKALQPLMQELDA